MASEPGGQRARRSGAQLQEEQRLALCCLPPWGPWQVKRRPPHPGLNQCQPPPEHLLWAGAVQGGQSHERDLGSQLTCEKGPRVTGAGQEVKGAAGEGQGAPRRSRRRG